MITKDIDKTARYYSCKFFNKFTEDSLMRHICYKQSDVIRLDDFTTTIIIMYAFKRKNIIC